MKAISTGLSVKFKRITENKSYQAIVDATEYFKINGFDDEVVRHHELIKALNLDLMKTTTAGVGICGEEEYSGFIVTNKDNNYKVIEIYIDILCPYYTSVRDISDNLKQLNPSHRLCDIRKPISMAIIYWLEQFGEVPKNVLRYTK